MSISYFAFLYYTVCLNVYQWVKKRERMSSYFGRAMQKEVKSVCVKVREGRRERERGRIRSYMS